MKIFWTLGGWLTVNHTSLISLLLSLRIRGCAQKLRTFANCETLNVNKTADDMAAAENSNILTNPKEMQQGFVETTEEEVTELIEGSKSKNTNRSTKSAMTRFKAFLQLRHYPDIDNLDLDELLTILSKFYTDVRTKKQGEQY